MRIIGLIFCFLICSSSGAWAEGLCSSTNLSACPNGPFNTVVANTVTAGVSPSTVTVPSIQTKTLQVMLQRLVGHVSVLEYGADPLGNIDSTAAIQGAINAAAGTYPSLGGSVDLYPGNYKISSPGLIIGNGGGSVGSPSTVSGIKLVCVAAWAGGGNNDNACNLNSSYAGPAITVNGPIQGWGLENIGIVANTTSTSAGGLLVNSGQWGKVDGLLVSDFYDYGIKLTTSGATPSDQNVFRQINIVTPTGGTTAVGLYIGCPQGGGCEGSFSDSFDDTFIAVNNPGATGLYAGSSDSERFRNLTFANSAAGNKDIVFDYSQANNNAWPSNYLLYGLETGNGNVGAITNIGTPPYTLNEHNIVYAFSRTNGAPYPVLPNLILADLIGKQGVDLREFGDVPDDTTDNSTAMQNALTWAATSGGTLLIPPGTTYYAVGPTATLPANATVTFQGQGPNLSLLRPASGQNGLTLLSGTAQSSIHVDGIGFLASGAGAGDAIHFTANGATVFSQTTVISNATFRGADGYGASDYWANGFYTDLVSNINFLNDTFYGTNGTYHGTGINLAGGTGLGVIYNVSASNFQALNKGINLGNNIQGLTISQGNFTPDNYGVYVGPGLSGLDQISVVASQFNQNTVGIDLLSPVVNVVLSGGNLFSVNATNETAIYIAEADQCSITGNAINGINFTIPSSAIGIDIEGVEGTRGCAISGNSMSLLDTAVKLGSGTAWNKVSGNQWGQNNTKITSASINNEISGLGLLSTTVTNAVNDESGGTLLTVGSTSGFVTGEWVMVAGVGGIPILSAAGLAQIVVSDSSHLDLVNTGFGGTYTSGGVVWAVP
jgi:hypothetical protein